MLILVHTSVNILTMLKSKRGGLITASIFIFVVVIIVGFFIGARVISKEAKNNICIDLGYEGYRYMPQYGNMCYKDKGYYTFSGLGIICPSSYKCEEVNIIE